MKKFCLIALMAFSYAAVIGQLITENSKDLRINEFLQAGSINNKANSFDHLHNGSFINDAPVDYLQKSKNQKTWAWILTGVGVGIVTIGLLIQDYVDAAYSIDDEKNSTSPAVYAVGGGFIAGGIILFAGSSKNKKKAMRSSAIFKMEKNAVWLQHSAALKVIPAAGIRINLQ